MIYIVVVPHKMFNKGRYLVDVHNELATQYTLLTHINCPVTEKCKEWLGTISLFFFFCATFQCAAAGRGTPKATGGARCESDEKRRHKRRWEAVKEAKTTYGEAKKRWRKQVKWENRPYLVSHPDNDWILAPTQVHSSSAYSLHLLHSRNETRFTLSNSKSFSLSAPRQREGSTATHWSIWHRQNKEFWNLVP